MDVKFFGSEECVECQVGMFLLDSYAVPYEYLDVKSDEDSARQLRQLAGEIGTINLPAVVVGGKLLIDPAEDELAAAMGLN